MSTPFSVGNGIPDTCRGSFLIWASLLGPQQLKFTWKHHHQRHHNRNTPHSTSQQRTIISLSSGDTTNYTSTTATRITASPSIPTTLQPVDPMMSQPATLPDLVMAQAKQALHDFYSINSHVDPSHGAPHALRVLQHAEYAIAATQECKTTTPYNTEHFSHKTSHSTHISSSHNTTQPQTSFHNKHIMIPLTTLNISPWSCLPLVVCIFCVLITIQWYWNSDQKRYESHVSDSTSSFAARCRWS